MIIGINSAGIRMYVLLLILSLEYFACIRKKEERRKKRGPPKQVVHGKSSLLSAA